MVDQRESEPPADSLGSSAGASEIGVSDDESVDEELAIDFSDSDSSDVDLDVLFDDSQSDIDLAEFQEVDPATIAASQPAEMKTFDSEDVLGTTELLAQLEATKQEKADLALSLESALSQLDSKNQHQQQQIENLQQQLDAINNEKTELTTRLTELESANRESGQAMLELNELKGQLEIKNQEYTDLKNQFEEAQSLLEAKQAEFDQTTVASTAAPADTSEAVAEIDRKTKEEFTKLYRAHEKERNLRKESEANLNEAEQQRDAIAKTLAQLKREQDNDQS